MKNAKYFKRVFAVLLCAVMLLSCLPGTAFDVYATSDSGLWTQYGSIDNTTGGKWQSNGYGTEQAILLGFGDQAYLTKATASSTEAGKNTSNGIYLRKLQSGGYYVDNEAADAITYTNFTGLNYVWQYNRYVDGVKVTQPELEKPAKYDQALYDQIQWNGYIGDSGSAHGLPSTNANFPCANIALNEGYTYRTGIKFNLPDDTTEYLFTVYANTLNWYNDTPDADVQFRFFSQDGTTEYGSAITLNIQDFDKTGGYISFKVKGDFALAIDLSDSAARFSPSAFFFDAAPQDLADNVLNAVQEPWTYVGSDTTTKGAWNTKGYGSYDALFPGYNYTDTVSAGTRNAGLKSSGVYSANGKVSMTANYTEVWGFGSTGETGTNPQSDILVNTNPAVTNVFDAYMLSGSTADVPNVTGEPELETDWYRHYFTFSGLDSDQVYEFRIYSNNHIADGYFRGDWADYAQTDLKVHFVDEDGNVHSNVEAFSCATFTDGAYRTYIVKGNFTLILDRLKTTTLHSDTNTYSASRFGLQGFFFDEYEAPPAVTTPEESEPVAIWSQVRDIDNNTGGKWQTKGYGTEQAMLVGFGDQTFITNLTNAQGGTNGSAIDDSSNKIYSRKTNGLTMYRSNTDSNAITTTSVGPQRTWYFNRLENGVKATSPTLEKPEGYDSDLYSQILWNCYFGVQNESVSTTSGGFGWPSDNTNFPYTDIALNTVDEVAMTNRWAMKFNLPNDTTEYFFTIYADTLNYYTATPDADFQIRFANQDGTEVYSTTTLNIQDFGKTGGYITFKVQGNFALIIDTSWSARFFGPSAFFFDTTPVREELVENVGDLLAIDDTTKGNWHTAGYGDVDAILWGANLLNATYNSNTFDVTTNNNQYYSNYTGDSKYDDYGYNYHSTGTVKLSGKSQYSSLTAATNGTELYYPVTGQPMTYNAYFRSYNGITSADDTTVPGRTFETNPLPAVDEAGGWKRNYYTFSGLTAGKQYELTLYSNVSKAVCANYSNSPVANDLHLYFVDSVNEIVYDVGTLSSTDFANGRYLTYLIEGNMTMVIDHLYSSSGWFGFNGIFFDEYVPAKIDKAEVASITLDGTIGVNYGMNLNIPAKEDTGAAMQFTQGSDSVSVSTFKNSQGLRWYSYGLAAKEMSDVISGQMEYSDSTTGSSKDYSVRQYAETLLSYTTTGGTLKELLVRMLNYGAYCQAYWGYNTNNMANKHLTEETKTNNLNIVIPQKLAGYANAVEAGTDVQLAYASLLLKSGTVLRLSFLTEEAEGKTFKLVKDSGEVELTLFKREGSYCSYVDITNIAAAELDNTYTVNIYDGETLVSTVSYSPMAYIHAVLVDGSDAKLVNLVKSLYLYNQAANAYFG